MMCLSIFRHILSGSKIMSYSKELKLGSGWQLTLLDDGEFEGEITRERDLPESAIAASVPGDFVLDVVRRRTEDPYYQDNYLQSL